MKRGTVKWFNPQKGFGFIIHEDKDVFVHFKDVEGGVNVLSDGDEVEFEIGEGKKGPQAINVKKV